MTTFSAFAPGHVSGLFAPHHDEDPLRRGSRGCGWSLEMGAHATVSTADEPRLEVNGQLAELASLPVTRDALARLVGERPLDISLRHELPVGQGFGMSAAGTLAVCLASASIIDAAPETALEATHWAEVTNGTGLGDAIGSWFGSGELRVKPGCPPHGWAMQVPPPHGTEFLYCVLGEAIATADILADEEVRETAQILGDEAVDRIVEAGRDQAWLRILLESSFFTQQLSLMPLLMKELAAELPEGVRWGQCMLGSTMWVTGETGILERAHAVLEGQGDIFRARVDSHGARMTRTIAR